MTVSMACIRDLDLHRLAMKDWKFLGRRLNVEESTVTSIEKDCQGNGQLEMCYQVFYRWTEEQGLNATYLNLIKALEKENLNNLVEPVKLQAQKVWEEK